MKKKVIPLLMGTLFLLGFVIIPAMAQEKTLSSEKTNITIQLTVQKKTLPGEKITEAKTKGTELIINPKDILIYRLTCINEGEELIREVIITDPIPEGTEYLIDSASGDMAKITFSIDGGNTYQYPPVTYKIKKIDGTIQIKLAAPDMFTHIRWLFSGEIRPGKSRKASFEVIVK